MIEKEDKKKFYYPFCNEVGCDGILSVKLNDDFSLDYQCSKNEKHKKKKIFYKTFERFYLKEKAIEKCPKCHCDFGNDEYKCIKCNEIYCCYCFKLDEHIKNNIDNLMIIKKRCLIHKKDLVQYCFSCKKNICIYCTKENKEKNPHYEHIIEDFKDLIPSENEIDKLNHKIKKRKERYRELIQSLDEWEIKIYNKIEELKKNLMYEIELLEKMFSNFNKCFMDYTYFKNFEYFEDYMDNTYSSKFDKCYTFDDLKDILEKLFEKEETNEEPDLKEFELNEGYKVDGLITKINDEYIFCYSFHNDNVKIMSIDNHGINALDKTIIDFRQRIYSAYVSLKKNRIFATLSNSRKVVIFNFDLENELMEKSEDEIYDNDNGGIFNKCIEINDEYLATGDNKSIIIWKKFNKEYVNIKKIYLNEETYDLLLVNNEYFVSSQDNRKTITFISISNLKEDKAIKNIDSINDNNCLFLFKNYIFVNCYEGIALISAETKDIIQYIQNFYSEQRYKSLFVTNNDNDYRLYILNSFDTDYNKQQFNIKIMRFEDDHLKLIEHYKKTQINEQGELQLFIMNNNKKFLIFGNNLYTLTNDI